MADKMIFETPRLLVRNLALSDFEPYFEMQSNPNVHRYTGSTPDDEPTARAGLQHHIACYSKPANNWWIWAIEQKTNQSFVGTAAVIHGENSVVGDGPEIGYRFLERYWGQGFATEICDPLIEYGIQQMALKSLFATVDVLNVASVKILEQSKLKFIQEYHNQNDNCTDRVYKLESDQT